MKRCCIIAPNDRYNYGDLLFTHVVLEKLGKAYDEISHIATIDQDLTGVGGHKVTSIKTLQDKNRPGPFDVIVAGGHSLFCPWPFVLYCLDKRYVPLSRLNYGLKKLIGEKISDKLIQHLSQVIFGVKTAYPYSIGKQEFTGINKLIYNSVDGNLQSPLSKKDKKILESVDYLSVRSKRTWEILKDNGLNALFYPDSAIQISSIFPKETLIDKVENTEIKSLIEASQGSTRYIVFQINRELGEKSFNDIIRNLRDILNRKDIGIVLCPIGFAMGHDDLMILEKIYDALNADRVKLYPSLTIWDIMTLIAYSEGFIGSSLHGCITAMSYCRPYLGLNVTKTTEYIKDWGLGEQFCSNCNDFSSQLDSVLNYSKGRLERNLNSQLQLSEESFKNIQSILQQ